MAAKKPVHPGALEAVLELFRGGDYVGARQALRTIDATKLAPREQELAAELFALTYTDRMTWTVGVSALGLLLLVMMVTRFFLQ